MKIKWEEPPQPTAADKFMDRFWSKVDFTDGCWHWTGSLNASGYGMFMAPPSRLAHRLSWAFANPDAEMPATLDHTCHTAACEGPANCAHRRCVNPDHLQPVSFRSNILRGKAITAKNARKTHCVRGHEFTEENTIVKTGKWGYPVRLCRACRRMWNQKRTGDAS